MVVDVVVDVDVDLGPSQALEVARTGRADRTAETAVRNVGGQRVAGGVHDQVHDYVHVHVHVHVVDGVREAERALTAFLHTL